MRRTLWWMAASLAGGILLAGCSTYYQGYGEHMLGVDYEPGRIENPEDYNIEIVDEDGDTLVDQPLSDEAFDVPVGPNEYVDVVVTRPDGERVRHRVFVRRAEQVSFRIGEDGGIYDVARIPQRRRENVGD